MKKTITVALSAMTGLFKPQQKFINRVRASFSLTLPTPPCVRLRTGRFISIILDNETLTTVPLLILTLAMLATYY